MEYDSEIGDLGIIDYFGLGKIRPLRTFCLLIENLIL